MLKESGGRKVFQLRAGLNSGEVVVGSIGNDLKMGYTAIGQTVHLASRMEQMATPGSILTTTPGGAENPAVDECIDCPLD
jgi:class 3 adenylate cyclase